MYVLVGEVEFRNNIIFNTNPFLMIFKQSSNNYVQVNYANNTSFQVNLLHETTKNY